MTNAVTNTHAVEYSWITAAVAQSDDDNNFILAALLQQCNGLKFEGNVARIVRYRECFKVPTYIKVGIVPCMPLPRTLVKTHHSVYL